MSITQKQNEIFSPNLTHMYGHTLMTFSGILPFGEAIIKQNMKLPLTTIEYYDIKCNIFRMHWCTITKLHMYRDHDLKVLKKL